MMTKIDDLINQTANEMQQSFNNISKKFKTPNDIAEKKEDVVREFLEKYFPKHYSFGKGEIIDSEGRHSPQIDIIICTPYHPLTYSGSKTDLFFAEGVGCAIDVKSDMADKRDLERGIKQIQKVKRLERKFEKNAQFYGNVDEANRASKIPCVLFADKGPSNLNKLKKNIHDIHEKLKIPSEEQTDLFVVLSKGAIIYNITGPGYPRTWAIKGQKLTGLFGTIWNEQTLFEFFYIVTRPIPRETRFLPIIHFYLEKGILQNPKPLDLF